MPRSRGQQKRRRLKKTRSAGIRDASVEASGGQRGGDKRTARPPDAARVASAGCFCGASIARVAWRPGPRPRVRGGGFGALASAWTQKSQVKVRARRIPKPRCDGARSACQRGEPQAKLKPQRPWTPNGAVEAPRRIGSPAAARAQLHGAARGWAAWRGQTCEERGGFADLTTAASFGECSRAHTTGTWPGQDGAGALIVASGRALSDVEVRYRDALADLHRPFEIEQLAGRGRFPRDRATGKRIALVDVRRGQRARVATPTRASTAVKRDDVGGLSHTAGRLHRDRPRGRGDCFRGSPPSIVVNGKR